MATVDNPPPSLSHRVPSTAAPEATSLPLPLPPYCFSVLFNLSSVSLRLIAFAAFVCFRMFFVLHFVLTRLSSSQTLPVLPPEH